MIRNDGLPTYDCMTVWLLDCVHLKYVRQFRQLRRHVRHVPHVTQRERNGPAKQPQGRLRPAISLCVICGTCLTCLLSCVTFLACLRCPQSYSQTVMQSYSHTVIYRLRPLPPTPLISCSIEFRRSVLLWRYGVPLLCVDSRFLGFCVFRFSVFLCCCVSMFLCFGAPAFLYL